MEFDNFSLNDSDFADDNALNIIDESKLRLLNMMSELVENLKNNVNFNEKGDYMANCNVLTNYMSALVDFNELTAENDRLNFSNEELMEKIDEIFKMTTEVTMDNIDSIIPKDEEEDTETKTNKKDDSNDLEW